MSVPPPMRSRCGARWLRRMRRHRSRRSLRCRNGPTMIDQRPLAIALKGPTASGKTALALDWAARLDTEIVSVDSALVYRRLDIGSAKPDAATLARLRHHLVDVRDPHAVYSAAEFADDALAAMHAIAARGRVPILAGG